MVSFKKIITRFHTLPKSQATGFVVFFHVTSIHPEREDIQLDLFLPGFKCHVNKGVNFIDAVVSHGVTTNGSTMPVYFYIIAGITFRCFKAVGITYIYRQMIFAQWVKLVGLDSVKSFRASAIPCLCFCPQPAG